MIVFEPSILYTVLLADEALMVYCLALFYCFAFMIPYGYVPLKDPTKIQTVPRPKEKVKGADANKSAHLRHADVRPARTTRQTNTHGASGNAQRIAALHQRAFLFCTFCIGPPHWPAICRRRVSVCDHNAYEVDADGPSSLPSVYPAFSLLPSCLPCQAGR